MDLHLETTHIKSNWRLWIEKLFQQSVDADVIKENREADTWLYFRRTNPRKFEIYLDEDFEKGIPQNPLLEVLNVTDPLSSKLVIESDDQLSLNISGTWIDCVRFEGVWVEALDTEPVIWDHQLLAEGRVVITKDQQFE